MDITIKHFDGERPQFNVMLHTAKGSEPFLEIKGCRIVNGTNGPFVSWPATKGNNGKYWNHVYAGEKFAAHVLALAQGGQTRRPPPPPRPAPTRAPANGSGFDDMADDIPF